MEAPVVKNASYILIHAPNTLIQHGATQVLERKKNPDSEFLTKLPTHIRTYDDMKGYPPYQVFIGRLEPEQLKEIPKPWYENATSDAERHAQFGEIMPEDELYGLMKVVDVFDLVWLEESFSEKIKDKLNRHPFLKDYLSFDNLEKGKPLEKVKGEVSKGEAPLYLDSELVGCIRSASDDDENLSSHIMLELLATKASGILALAHAFDKSDLSPEDIDFLLECSEEAAGDIYNRGGGGIGKSIGEALGCTNATGLDLKAFCAAPAHAIVQAAALVKSGLYDNVAVVAGGSVAKLGMNAKDHVKKGKPVLEDVLGGIAFIISSNDGKNPIITPVGKQNIGAGSSPKAVLSALVVDPLRENITRIDKYAPELQAPEILGRSIARSNYKMLGALAAIQGEIERNEINDFVEKHGVIGFAPQQGHIPSGVPYIGHARNKILDGEMRKAMIIGKGSLFLGRMTRLFDGVSFLVEKNLGKKTEAEEKEVVPLKKNNIGITLPGSEYGKSEIIKGAELASERNSDVTVTLIGPEVDSKLNVVETPDDEKAAHQKMEQMLKNGIIDASVTLHYNFPIGIATVGRVTTPNGEEMLISTTTGTMSSHKVEALTLNAISGIATAKSIGIENPTVGILNIEGARECKKILEKLDGNGYPIHFAESIRPESGGIMRGNDVLNGVPDVLVCDSLTGNVLIKVLSSFTTSGRKETFGHGYGPGLGEKTNYPVFILSRASGSPVIANAIEYAAQCAKGNVIKKFEGEMNAAKRAGLQTIIEDISETKEKKETNGEEVARPPKKEVTEEIEGIDVLRIEEALQALWSAGIYAESGMGCTGPVVMVAEEDKEATRELLEEKELI
ncbi:MAG: glycine reductase [Candidatus Korarchaeota archaeon]|nr:glycine reductase [Candidatus Korarchaeota archaeon]NIU82850.1 glycine reductase [Candidatus Thorarchaeota archaeon]NIW12544.1 glycine reductase [Candidatus Thorarchaeota archaeon]NIW50764.1 glycine reductase [Candidatus Korarchaeota archaeon]